jgi:predicted flap endonuclease-1-like 5' DNA nuclease
MSGPSLRALAQAGITSLDTLARWSRTDLAALHGMGPKGMRLLEDALAQRSCQLRP